LSELIDDLVKMHKHALSTTESTGNEAQSSASTGANTTNSLQYQQVQQSMSLKWKKLLSAAHTSQSASDVVSVFLRMVELVSPSLTQMHHFLNAVRRLQPIRVKSEVDYEKHPVVKHMRKALKILGSDPMLTPSPKTYAFFLDICRVHELPKMLVELRQAFFDKWGLKPTVSHYENMARAWEKV
jgi:hypothetical protein